MPGSGSGGVARGRGSGAGPDVRIASPVPALGGGDRERFPTIRGPGHRRPTPAWSLRNAFSGGHLQGPRSESCDATGEGRGRNGGSRWTGAGGSRGVSAAVRAGESGDGLGLEGGGAVVDRGWFSTESGRSRITGTGVRKFTCPGRPRVPSVIAIAASLDSVRMGHTPYARGLRTADRG